MSATELKTLFYALLRLAPFLRLIHRYGLRASVIFIRLIVTLTRRKGDTLIPG